jgi:hypothetical protein
MAQVLRLPRTSDMPQRPRQRRPGASRPQPVSLLPCSTFRLASHTAAYAPPTQPTPQGLDLRVEHTHCFSAHGQGGHYHYDTTPADVKYIGYYSLAESIWRVDSPKETHNVSCGRKVYVGESPQSDARLT